MAMFVYSNRRERGDLKTLMDHFAGLTGLLKKEGFEAPEDKDHPDIQNLGEGMAIRKYVSGNRDLVHIIGDIHDEDTHKRFWHNIFVMSGDCSMGELETEMQVLRGFYKALGYECNAWV
ncbi:MAG: hypothetical protein ABIB47_00100 [Candidatus Woesearchaeota archaeon]